MFNSASPRRTAIALAAFSICTVIQSVSADTLVTSTTGVLSNWTDTDAWNPSVIPNGNYSAKLLQDNGNFLLDANITLNNLTLEAGTQIDDIASNSITSGSLINTGMLKFDSFGTLNITGATTNAGGINFGANSIATFNGYNANGGVLNINGEYLTPSNSHITINGTTTLSGSSDSLSINNGSGAVLDLQTVQNNGNITVTGGSTINASTVLSEGFIGAYEGGVVNIGSLSNSGTLYLSDNGKINLTGGGLGITTVGADEHIYVGDQLCRINVINSGVPSDAFANLSTVAGTLNLGDQINRNLGNLSISGELTFGQATYNVNSLNLTGTLSMGDATMNITGGGSGITSIPSGVRLFLSNSHLNVINGGVPSDAIANLSSVDGYLQISNETNRHFNSLTINTDGFVSLNDSTITCDNLTNNGTLFLAGGQFNLTGGGSGITNIPANTSYIIGGDFNVVNAGGPSFAMANLSQINGLLSLRNGKTYQMQNLSVASTGTLNIFPSTTLNVQSLNNQGSLEIMGKVVINSGSITDIPGDSAIKLYDQGQFKTQNGTTNALNTLSSIHGYLQISNGDSYNWGNLNVSGALSVSEPSSRVNIQLLSLSGLISVYGDAAGVGVGSGTFTQTGGYQQLANGTLIDIISSLNRYGDFEINVGDISLNGILQIQLQNGYVPSPGDTFPLFNQNGSGSLTGAFTSVIGTPFPNGAWTVNYDTSTGDVSITAVSVPEPATLTIIALGGFGLLRRPRKSSASAA